MGVILQHPEYLQGVRMFVCNEIEAGSLFGCTLERSDISGALELARCEAPKRGIREIVITLGDQGAVYFDSASGESGHIPAKEATLVDSSGAGDAFFSGTTAARIHGYPLGSAADKGAQLAALTIQTDQSTCPRMEDFLRA
jgi:pseudouridine kinase